MTSIGADTLRRLYNGAMADKLKTASRPVRAVPIGTVRRWPFVPYGLVPLVGLIAVLVVGWIPLRLARSRR